MKIFLVPALALAASSSVYAQVTSLDSAVAAVADRTPQAAVRETAARPDILLRAGAEIPLIMREELTTRKKKLRVGQRFHMEVASNITKNGVTVIPGGTPALGEITEVRNKGMWGKSGYIGARVLSLRIGDRHIRLTGTFDDKGVTGTGGVVASIALIPLAGFFTTGTSAQIASGSSIKAFLDEDIVFHPVAASVQAIDVPVPAQAVTAPAAGRPAFIPVSDAVASSASGKM